MDFFEEKNEKSKYLKNCNAHRKKCSVVVIETKEEENAKIAAFYFVNCGRR